MFKNIMVAVDGSENGQRALEKAAAIAALTGATLSISHVVTTREIPDSLRHMAEVEHLIDRPEYKEGALGALSIADLNPNDRARVSQIIGEKILDDAAAEAGRLGCADVKTYAIHGDPADRLSEQATKLGVDLVVAGTRGLGRIERVILGSVSTKILQLVPCACMIVR